MRISEERYIRNRRRIDLAWRLLRHDARTSTISRLTGLSCRKIRSLVQSYAGRDRGLEVKRPRGNPPYRVDLLLVSRRQRREASVFAGLCYAQSVFHTKMLREVEPSSPEIARGERICSSFESLKRRIPESTLTIEHALLVIAALASGDEVELGVCEGCNEFVLIDRLAGAQQRCIHCATAAVVTPIEVKANCSLWCAGPARALSKSIVPGS